MPKRSEFLDSNYDSSRESAPQHASPVEASRWTAGTSHLDPVDLENHGIFKKSLRQKQIENAEAERVVNALKEDVEVFQGAMNPEGTRLSSTNPQRPEGFASVEHHLDADSIDTPNISENLHLNQPNTDSEPQRQVPDGPQDSVLARFPEGPNPIPEGVAPLKDSKQDIIPPNARWTKISRKLVAPEVLELGKERFEVRDEFLIVLRILSRDQVQKYAESTHRMRSKYKIFEYQYVC